MNLLKFYFERKQIISLKGMSGIVEDFRGTRFSEHQNNLNKLELNNYVE